MMFIGVDAHKATHTAAAVNRQTAELPDQATVNATPAGHEQLLAWATAIDADRVWAIEDCRNLSSGLERVLLQAGERVLRVPPKLMASQRKSERTFSKSDPIDAFAIARAAIREPRLPRATLPGIEQEIGFLVDHRDDLIKDASGHQRRLRWRLHQLDPEFDIALRTLNQPQSAQVRISRELHRRAKAIARELAVLVQQTNPELLAITGCGTLCAAIIIAEVAGIKRFANDAQLAAYAGVAPLDASSGRQQRHRLNRTGNRRLNRALHIITVTQVRIHPPAIEYYARRKANGKTQDGHACHPGGPVARCAAGPARRLPHQVGGPRPVDRRQRHRPACSHARNARHLAAPARQG